MAARTDSASIMASSAARRGDAIVTSDPSGIGALAAHTPGVTVIAT